MLKRNDRTEASEEAKRDYERVQRALAAGQESAEWAALFQEVYAEVEKFIPICTKGRVMSSESARDRLRTVFWDDYLSILRAFKEGRILGWFVKVCVENRVKRVYREELRHQASTGLPWGGWVLPSAPDIFDKQVDESERRATYEKYRFFLPQIPKNRRTVFELYFGPPRLSHDPIAQLLNLTRDTVRQRKRRALVQLERIAKRTAGKVPL